MTGGQPGAHGADAGPIAGILRPNWAFRNLDVTSTVYTATPADVHALRPRFCIPCDRETLVIQRPMLHRILDYAAQRSDSSDAVK